MRKNLSDEDKFHYALDEQANPSDPPIRCAAYAGDYVGCIINEFGQGAQNCKGKEGGDAPNQSTPPHQKADEQKQKVRRKPKVVPKKRVRAEHRVSTIPRPAADGNAIGIFVRFS